ncbi:hypothetical protein CAPTEDRAFT_222572 [Capitella teleta]|uniref:Sushi domain-containing protein n=1 Tax=Capitella teleta TaxID=283909 RepID=R7TIR5_CAPTE|nr:hypothetical protein CAPTEDRAFT_222572 [Capitella teleta]|eukprot:ELT90985.1 hypothetical protein CAPTEDRAFT_222572 [Capitella teleta]
MDVAAYLWIFASLVASLISGALGGDCSIPETPTDMTFVGKPKTDYKAGDVITYACDENLSGHFGAAYIKCKETASNIFTWSSLNRACDEAIPVDGGSIAGICVACFNVVSVVVAIFVTKIWYSDSKLEEET